VYLMMYLRPDSITVYNNFLGPAPWGATTTAEGEQQRRHCAVSVPEPTDVEPRASGSGDDS